MCGIAGWYRRKGRRVSREAISAQCDRLVHRGPDDEGYLIDDDFGFGMRRLSIIDISGGHQPIDSIDGRYSIVCNGEIVNHPDLRRRLASYPFRTNSDVETLLAAFLKWGEDAWLELEGMYAAAIWDRKTRRLVLARDPLGIKPLYVTEQDGGIAFASEISALRALPNHRFDIDERGVDDFFRFGHVLGPRSIFRQVRWLEPGHVLEIGAEGAPSVREFWKPQIHARRGLSEREWIEETRRRVLAAVEQHMLADVPVGAFLSGGVDSGAITAAMAQSSPAPVKAFTASFPESKLDEAQSARAIANHLGCKHFVLPIEPMTAAEVLPAVQRAFDEPSAANSAIPLWYLSRTAAREVKVVLCGEGGDELFIGYNRQRWARRMGKWSGAVRLVGGAKFIDKLPKFSSRKMNYLHEYAQKFRDGASLADGYERFFSAVRISSPATRARLYDRGFWDRHDGLNELAELAGEYFPARSRGKPLADLDQFELGDLMVHMPASLLQRLDRATMAHSLEARVPFLTHSFVDWALTIPSDLKLRGGIGKYVLRKAVEPWLPKGALRRRKLGFQMPLADWFVGDFNEFARDAWRSSGAKDAGFLNPAEVERLFDEHRAGLGNHGRLLYAIAMFSCWWKEQGPDASAADRELRRANGR